MKYFFTMVLLISCSLLGAQQRHFILLLKGDVFLIQPNHSPIKAKPLQSLSLNDGIQLGNDQSEITIGNTTGGRTVIKGKGIYKITDIQKKEDTRGPGETSKFFTYLYEELLHPKKGFSQQSIAASWGGGERGATCNTIKWPLNNSFSSKDSIAFKWGHESGTLNYNFILYDSEGNDLFNCNLRDTQIVVNMAKLRTGEEKRYFWSINSVIQPCRTIVKYFFDLVSREEEEKMVAALIKEVAINDNKILYDLEIADKLGQNGFIDKALEYFDKSYQQIKNRK
jgi:hypothetical protein